MADEDLLGTMDDLGGEEEAEEEHQEDGSPLMKYLPLIGGALVVQIVIAYFVASWWFVPSEAPPEAAQAQAEQMQEGAPEPEQEMAPPEVAVVYEKLEPVVVNPAGTEGLRFLSVTIHLGLSSPSVEAMIDQKKLGSKMSDRLIDILRSKTIGQLEPANHEVLKKEIKEKLNTILGGKPGTAPPIVEVYFQGFVLQ